MSGAQASPESRIPFCAACQAAFAHAEATGAVARLCWRCWELCVETGFHPYGCAAPDCAARARQQLWSTMAYWGEAGGEVARA